ncbi:MAG: hypothetical protein O7F16_01220 [Acidobacteria bacterium]|nr:hypothetical protein [Acidobacteriota bacterium]
MTDEPSHSSFISPATVCWGDRRGWTGRPTVDRCARPYTGDVGFVGWSRQRLAGEGLGDFYQRLFGSGVATEILTGTSIRAPGGLLSGERQLRPL